MGKKRAKRSGGKLTSGFSTGVKEKALIVPEKGFAAIGNEMGGKGYKGGFRTFGKKGKNKAVKTLLS